MKDVLKNSEHHEYRYLIHDNNQVVIDELHELERALAAPQGEHRHRFDQYVRRVYELNLEVLEPLRLLANVDHQLSELP